MEIEAEGFANRKGSGLFFQVPEASFSCTTFISYSALIL
jgi:hypothetical protein